MTIENPDDCIHILSTDDPEKFSLTCEELANKNARDILDQLEHGINTATDIARTLGLSIQAVISHLNALEKIGLIESKIESIGNRGRSPRYYRVSKAAILLIPNEINKDDGRSMLKSIMKDKAFDLLKKQLMLSTIVSILATVCVFWVSSIELSHILFSPSNAGFVLSDSFALILAVLAGACAYFATSKLASRLT